IDVSAADLPLIITPADIDVNAKGLLTRVNPGVAQAVDRSGNPIAVSQTQPTVFYEPGVNTVLWRAVDSQQRSTLASQQLNVHPLISLAPDQRVLEGFAVTTTIYLNGVSPVYPLVIPYRVGGSAEPGVDHNLFDGVVIIESGTEGFINFNVHADEPMEGVETIIIELSLEPNGVALNLAEGASHTFMIDEHNVAPKVTLQLTQAGVTGFTVNREAGEVVISAEVTHPDRNKQYDFEWQPLPDTDAAGLQYSFDPITLEPGMYQVGLEVTDHNDAQFKGQQQVTFKVVEKAPVMGVGDSDGDGVADNVEGAGDSDQDGIPDYLDAINACNVLQQQLDDAGRFLIEVDPGVCLRLGDTALAGEGSGARLVDNQPSDENIVNIGGFFDIIVHGLEIVVNELEIVGQSRFIVQGQVQPIPNNAVYRRQGNGTTTALSNNERADFIESDSDQLWSAPGDVGACPPPGDNRWQPGLITGYWCVQLQLSDGGPNDADEMANGTIVIAGGVGVVLGDNRLPQALDDDAQTRSNTPLTIDVLANDSDIDGDNLSLDSLRTQFGTAWIADNQIEYQPAINFFGVDTLIYGITDGRNGSAIATLIIAVVSNRFPLAVADSAQTVGTQHLLIDVLANDSDPENDLLTVIGAIADHGTVNIDIDNKLIYQANSGFIGHDSITYQIADALGAEAVCYVNVK
ncbi:MAG: cadherin-like domain-containing protein, partial [Psychrosphaera sp.]|nr:cadherin-like domain-containing protein [Psychrosphaera sp.]